MKQLKVAAAVIRRGNKVFAVQRGYGEFKDGWEFPGGKIEADESPRGALKREIREEHNTLIRPGELIGVTETDYPGFHLTMYCYWCAVIEGNLELLEAEDARWLDSGQLDSVDWLPADRSLIPVIRKTLEKDDSGKGGRGNV